MFTLLFGFVFSNYQAEAIRYVKVIFIGNYGSGKSDLKAAYFERPMNSVNYIDFFLEERTIDHQGETFQLKIWDTVGEEEIYNLVRGFFQGSSIAFVTIDLQKAKSKGFARNDMHNKFYRWLEEIYLNARDCKIVLAGTKTEGFSSDELETASRALSDLASNYYSQYFPDIQVIITDTKERRDNARNDVESCIRNAIDNIETQSLSLVDNFIRLRISEMPDPVRIFRDVPARLLPAFWHSGCWCLTSAGRPLGIKYKLVVDNN